ncbi:MAG TPA: PBS lyase, partial [Cyanobacteria bacterium UBA11149]|nr:PBS lyase [Cyanobacteria bacterium UBA11149]
AKYAPDIANILLDDKVNSYVRSSAAYALIKLGKAGAKYVPDILNFLKDDKVEPNIRVSVAEALDNLGDAGGKYVPDILNFLTEEKVNPYIRSNAAYAVGNLGEAGAKYVPDILNFLKDDKVNSDVRDSAAYALIKLGEVGAKYVPDILSLLTDEKVDKYIRMRAAEVLGKIRKLETQEDVIVLNNIYQRNQSDLEEWRFFTYFLGGGTDEVKTLLQWLGYPQETPTQVKYEDGQKTLELFLSIWTVSNDLKGLQKDLADKIAEVTSQVTWKPQDITLLESHYNNLKQGGYNQADTIQVAINKLGV